MVKSFTLATLGYVVPSFALGFTWHFVLFHDAYAAFGIYNRAEPIIPLGLLSIVVQGLVMAYLYPLFYRGGTPLGRGVAFGLLMGSFLFSVSTLANAAKIDVSGIGAWFAIQAAFHATQFTIAGALIGLAYGRAPVRQPRESMPA